MLKQEGEMATLVKNYDWASTALGDTEQWPTSLRTAVSLVLCSKFPMLLMWGDDLIQFYNDAYRSSLGNNGKHPHALGQRAQDHWSEMWDVVSPLIEQVRNTGNASYSEDQLIPINRNGNMEDAYWTFSHSPVLNEAGKVEGVLVVSNETTEKVKSRKRIEASDKRFQNLVRDATVGIIVLLGEACLVETANQAYGELINSKPEELIGRHLFDVITEAAEPFKSIIDWVRNSGESVYLYDQYYYIIKNDAKKEGFLNLIYQPYKEDEGNIVGVMILCQDVTEQVLARQKIDYSEQRLQSIIQAAPVAIGLFIGRDLIVEMPNQAFIDIVGKGPNISGIPLREVMPELITENQPYLQILDDVFTSGVEYKTFGSQVRIVRNGVLNNDYYNFTYTPLFNPEGEVYAILDIAVDVTEQVHARKRLAQSEENLRNTILKAPTAMCILKGPDQIIEIANHRMIELWGKDATVLNKPLIEALPEIEGQGFMELLHEVYTTGRTHTDYGVPVQLPRNGKVMEVYCNYVYQAYRETDDIITGIIVVANEVTEQVLARQKIEEIVAERTEALAAANTDLHRSNAELEQFAYIASHDLQEPLRKVRTFTEMLQQSLGHIDERSQGYLNKINVSAARMTDLIRDVLAYSQLSKEDESYTMVDLQQVIQDVAADFELLIEQKTAKITYEALPTIEAIPLQLSQLFGNLISNSLKFTHLDRLPVIEITATLVNRQDLKYSVLPLDDNEYYKIAVRDNGIGFNEAYADRIFNIFQRLHGKSSFTGTGIGLSICKKIVQNHHGEIYATGVEGEGATFIVILPAKQI